MRSSKVLDGLFGSELLGLHAFLLICQGHAFRRLRSLSLARNGIDDAGLAMLANGLGELRLLQELVELNLMNNSIGSAGIEKLVSAVREHDALRVCATLRLEGNAIADSGLLALAEVTH